MLAHREARGQRWMSPPAAFHLLLFGVVLLLFFFQTASFPGPGARYSVAPAGQ